MGTLDWPAPAGCNLAAFDTIDSTNAEALRRARDGHTSPLWVVSQEQTAGRGRHGRSWNSPRGNMYASRLMAGGEAPSEPQTLPFVAGLAAYDAALSVGVDPDATGLRLKWPNDLVAGQAKLAGILGESETVAGHRVAVIGTGINVMSTTADRATASLHELGSTVTPADLFAAFAKRFADWLAVWNGGAGFADIRLAWLQRAGELGRTTSVRLGTDRLAGRFAGLDPSGALLLDLDDGTTRRISTGDVMMAG